MVEFVGERGVKTAQIRAGRLLHEHWNAVERVAEALVAKLRLTGEEVRQLVRHVSTKAAA